MEVYNMSKKDQPQHVNRGKKHEPGECGNRRGVKWGVALLLTLLLVGVFFYIDPDLQKESLAAAPPQEAKVDAGVTFVSYPETTFADGKARHFQYKTSGATTVRYFVLKSSDGVIRAAFDACDVCWPENKGYYQDGDYMVCKNCGKRFQSTKVNVVTGGCNPSALERTIQDGKVVIQVKHIEEGKRFFAGRSGQGRG
jgi:uncharacterized membrane protein